MLVCWVVGQATATAKSTSLLGHKLLLCGPVKAGRGSASAGRGDVGDVFLAVDAAGAGEGDLVAVVCGEPARAALSQSSHPVATDAVVVAILDSVRIGGQPMPGTERR